MWNATKTAEWTGVSCWIVAVGLFLSGPVLPASVWNLVMDAFLDTMKLWYNHHRRALEGKGSRQLRIYLSQIPFSQPRFTRISQNPSPVQIHCIQLSEQRHGGMCSLVILASQPHEAEHARRSVKGIPTQWHSGTHCWVLRKWRWSWSSRIKGHVFLGMGFNCKLTWRSPTQAVVQCVGQRAFYSAHWNSLLFGDLLEWTDDGKLAMLRSFPHNAKICRGVLPRMQRHQIGVSPRMFSDWLSIDFARLLKHCYVLSHKYTHLDPESLLPDRVVWSALECLYRGVRLRKQETGSSAAALNLLSIRGRQCLLGNIIGRGISECVSFSQQESTTKCGSPFICGPSPAQESQNRFFSVISIQRLGNFQMFCHTMWTQVDDKIFVVGDCLTLLHSKTFGKKV